MERVHDPVFDRAHRGDERLGRDLAPEHARPPVVGAGSSEQIPVEALEIEAGEKRRDVRRHGLPGSTRLAATLRLMTERVKVEDHGGVRLLTLSRPEKKNAFDIPQALGAWEAIETAASDDAVKVIALTSEGDYFSGGADLNLFLSFGTADPEDLSKVARLYEPLRACKKPSIAIVQGHCVGMGVTLLPHFDLVYAADHVTFRTPFVELGLVLEYGSSFALPRLIGLQRTKDLILRAAPLDAKTAAEWGLVTRVFDAASLLDEAMKIAAEIAAHPAGAVAECKRLIDAPNTFDEATRAEDAALASRYGSAESVQAIMRIMARKRKS